MAKPISDKQKADIIKAYQITPSVSQVSRQLGHSRKTVAYALQKKGVSVGQSVSADVVADAIIKRIEKDPTAFSKNFEQLSRVLGSSDVIGVLRNPEKYKDAMVTQARTAAMMCLSFLITDNRISEASPSAVAQLLPQLCEIASGKYTFSSGKNPTLNSEEIISSIQVCLKRIRTFNPVLANETSATIKEIEALDATAFSVKDNDNNDK